MTAPAHALMAVPFVAALEAEARAALIAAARVVTLPAGARVFEAGQTASAFLIVMAGSVRVRLTAATGREIVLYRVAAGESCVLTTASLLDQEAYAAEALCETAVTAMALPKPEFRRLLAQSEGFRDHVLAAYSARVADLIVTIEETRFHRLDARLAEFILTRAADGPMTITHQDLAVELGTAREVISRTLKRLTVAGAVTSGRGTIAITDRLRLIQISQER
jgi:CRP/FNR family transcriptional regulator